MLRTFVSIVSILIAASINAAVIPTIFGDIEEHNPAILELVNSKAIQRLRNIDQSGSQPYFCEGYAKFSRYDHSLGVYALLKKFNAPINEQISGLMHDASHTVFSHVADIIFQTGAMRTESYQDSIHDWFLKNMDVEPILAKYDLSISDISPKNPAFTALEQPYPDMNADRIEYNLHTAAVLNDLDQNDVQNILSSLNFVNNIWYFNDTTNAKKFAKLSLYYTKTFWGDPSNIATHTVTSAAIKYAMDKNIITTEDIHFGTDEQIIDKLSNSKDPIIKKLINIMHNMDAHFVICKNGPADLNQPVKMRGIDPWVKANGTLVRLSKISRDYKNELELTAQYAKQGVSLNFINIADPAVLDLLRKANS